MGMLVNIFNKIIVSLYRGKRFKSEGRFVCSLYKKNGGFIGVICYLLRAAVYLDQKCIFKSGTIFFVAVLIRVLQSGLLVHYMGQKRHALLDC